VIVLLSAELEIDCCLTPNDKNSKTFNFFFINHGQKKVTFDDMITMSALL